MSRIETISEKIVCTETQITITDEKLKNILSFAYERAREDAQKKKWYNYYMIGFSIAMTLLLTLLTATFHSLGSINARAFTIMAWVAFAVSTGYGIIALIVKLLINIYKKEHNERDEAIKQIMKNINSYHL